MTAYTQDSNLVLWLPMTIGSGTHLNDYSGNSNDGTINGADWLKIPYMGSYALEFNGSSDYVSGSLGSITTVMTVSAWIKTDGSGMSGNWGGIVSDGGILAFQKWQLRRDNDNVYEFVWDNQSYTSSAYTDATNIEDDEWHHIVGVYDGSQMKLYVDGILADTHNYSGTISSSTSFSIGRYESSAPTYYYFQGIISDVMIWNKALTIEEIKDIYKNTYRS